MLDPVNSTISGNHQSPLQSTSLGWPSVDEQVETVVDEIREPSSPGSLWFIDVPGGDLARWHLGEALSALAGLTDYQKVVDEWLLGAAEIACEEG